MFYLFNRYFSLNLFIIWVSEFILIFLTSLSLISIQLGIISADVIESTFLLIKSSLLATIYFVMLYYFDLFTPELYRPGRQMALKLFQSVIIAPIILISIYFFIPLLRVERWILAGNSIALPILLIAWRAIYTRVLSVKFPEERVLIIGYGDFAKKIGHEIINWYGHGLKLVGFIDDDPTPVMQSSQNRSENKESERLVNADDRARQKEDAIVIGGYGDILRIVNSEKIYQIIIAPPDRRAKLPMSALLECKLRGIRIVEGETFHERITGKIPLDQLKPSWMVFSEGFKSLRSRKMLKRFLDICISITGLILSFPILLITYLLIKLESNGPALFKQVRVGENEKEFKIFKFRSMRFDAELNTGPVWTGEKDERITRVGKIIRNLRIDEIPQMINVLKGEMSFVGPRPERPHFVTELKRKIPYYEMRTVVKPGITGWAQIKYSYTATVKDTKEKLQYDIFYIKNMSPLLDALIIFSTIKIVLSKKGAR